MTMKPDDKAIRHSPIGKKLQRLMKITVGLALLLTLLANSLIQGWQMRRESLRQAASIGEIIGFNAKTALFERGSDTGKETLAALQSWPEIKTAQLYDGEGLLLADYVSANREAAAAPATLNQAEDEAGNPRFQVLEQVLIQPILHNNRPIGTLRLTVDCIPLWTKAGLALIPGLLVVLLAYAVSASYGRRLTGRFIHPLMGLARKAVQEEGEGNGHDSTAAEKDEIGQIAQGLEHMIGKIEAREKALADQNDRLLQEVENRTADLHHALESVQASNKAKSEFLATMSHEIRTPLNGVLGMTELLMSTGLNERQGWLVEKSYRSAKSLLGTINNILDFSNLEAGKLQLMPVDFDLRKLLEEIVELFADQAYRKGVELLLNIPVDFNALVIGDCERLRQVLVNLMGNAVKFTDSGEVQLKLSQLGESEKTGRFDLLFEILDTGPGIAEEMQKHFSERAPHSGGPITWRYDGTGLGLTISQHLVQLMGGQLRFDTHPVQGARFYFSLELPVSPVTRIDRADIEAIRGVHILVVDDNATNRQILDGQLRQWGAKVTCVDTGPKALKLLHDASHRNVRYRLVLLDWHMPNMDGFSLARAIQADPLIPRIPLIMLSSEGINFDQDDSNFFGISYCLEKPVFQDKLLGCLLELLAENPDPFDMPPLAAPADASAALSASAESGDNRSPTAGILEPMTMESLKSVTDAKGLCLFRKAATIFLRTAPDFAAKIQASLDAQNANEVGKLAHSLKSASAELGAKHFADLCHALEDAGRAGDANEVDRVYQDFEAQFTQVQEALQYELEQLDNAKANGQSSAKDAHRKSEIGVTILLVDDDPTFRVITSETLRYLGYRVLEAKSGTSALHKVKLTQPDLIILDALMDDLDGFETCKALRAMPGMADVPIIMSTGLDDIDSITKAYSVGASDFVIKPLNYTVLQYHIQFLLRTSRNTSELRNIKQQLSAAQKIARLGYWVWYVEQNRFVISSYLAELCGIDLDSFNETLDGFLDLVDPEDRLKVEDAVYSALEGETTGYVEYSLRTKDNETIIVRQETVLMSTGYLDKMLTATVQDISRQKETERMIHQLAYYDELTGLASRAFYQERIDQIIKSARRSHERFAFLYLDMDEFKYVNDSFGHNVGDQFLKTIAQRIKSVIREVDFAVRLGGDEFCIIVDNITDDCLAKEIAERCLHEINRPLMVGSNQLKPRVSIGIAIYPEDGENEHDLMKAADAAMYSAKNSGKQRYAYYRPEMTALALKRLQDEHLLREAVERDQFVLYYQPQVDASTGSVVGVEALLRWKHPHRGIVPPLEFISLAENLGLIKKLGNWVIRNACTQVVQWHKQGLPLLQVGVNISPLHFRDPQLIETAQDILDELQLNPEYLLLEVTESVMQTQGDLDIFGNLKKIGIKIAIDDFGTGYSSLASLKKLPVDCLKIDKTFVQDMLYDPVTQVLLDAIINISLAMGYDLVAEGVETFDQLDRLREKGCQKIQGYLFSQAIRAEDMPGLMAKDFSLSGIKGASNSTIKLNRVMN